MSKKVKYILGYASIFLLAVVCTFGIINYSKLKNKTPENNSQNLGSVDGKKTDKETTIIIEKLSTLNDIDSLNSELKLSDSVLKILKKYAPTVSYAVDNSEGQEKVLIRQGGYYAQNVNNGVDELIGAYKIVDGKFESTNEDLQLLSTKYSGDDKLKWKVMNLNNTEHDKDVARDTVDILVNSMTFSPDFDAAVSFFYFMDKNNVIVPDKGRMISYVPKSLAELTDIYNSRFAETLSPDQVRQKVANTKFMKYKEVDESYKESSKKYIGKLNSADIIYFKKDNMYLASIPGHPNPPVFQASKQDKWKVEGDKLTIPIVAFAGSEPKGTIVLRLNNKKYEGGQSRTKYYVESLDLKG